MGSSTGPASGEGAERGTARCLILVTPDAQRTMCTYLGASVGLDPADLGLANGAPEPREGGVALGRRGARLAQDRVIEERAEHVDFSPPRR